MWLTTEQTPRTIARSLGLTPVLFIMWTLTVESVEVLDWIPPPEEIVLISELNNQKDSVNGSEEGKDNP